ncbi:MAG: NDP-sugar synthase [Myxococcales bacterium]|nr:NDP-sugar synthase [Myxococcales bacterium]
MRALILAAGLGTRMGMLSAHRAKPAIPVLDVPLVARAAAAVAAAGITEVAVNLHHRGADVREALGDGSSWGLRVHYSEEHPILGTGGAIRHLSNFLGADGEDFVVVNGDTLWDVRLDQAIAAHRRAGRIATLVTIEAPGAPGHGAVRVDGERVAALLGARDAGTGEGRPATFTGIQILRPEIFDHMPDREVFSSTEDLYAPLLRAGESLGAWPHAGYWNDLGTPPRYLATLLDLLTRPRPLGAGLGPEGAARGEESEVAPRTRVRGPVWIGAGARVDLAGTLGPHAVVGAGARLGGSGDLHHAFVWPGAEIRLDASAAEAILTPWGTLDGREPT